jgi:hypothetical protein
METQMTDRLLDSKDLQDEKPAPQFEKLQGLLKGSFRSLGGGEAFLRRERGIFRASRPVEEK